MHSQRYNIWKRKGTKFGKCVCMHSNAHIYACSTVHIFTVVCKGQRRTCCSSGIIQLFFKTEFLTGLDFKNQPWPAGQQSFKYPSISTSLGLGYWSHYRHIWLLLHEFWRQSQVLVPSRLPWGNFFYWNCLPRPSLEVSEKKTQNLELFLSLW